MRTSGRSSLWLAAWCAATHLPGSDEPLDMSRVPVRRSRESVVESCVRKLWHPGLETLVHAHHRGSSVATPLQMDQGQLCLNKGTAAATEARMKGVARFENWRTSRKLAARGETPRGLKAGEGVRTLDFRVGNATFYH